MNARWRSYLSRWKQDFPTLSDSCRKQLESAETRIEILLKRAGEVKPEPFDPKNV